MALSVAVTIRPSIVLRPEVSTVLVVSIVQAILKKRVTDEPFAKTMDALLKKFEVRSPSLSSMTVTLVRS